jgi:hypothetical protein
VQVAGDIRRGKYDAESLGFRALAGLRLEVAGLLPALVQAALYLGGGVLGGKAIGLTRRHEMKVYGLWLPGG